MSSYAIALAHQYVARQIALANWERYMRIDFALANWMRISRRERRHRARALGRGGRSCRVDVWGRRMTHGAQ